MELESILKQIRPDDNQCNCLSGIVSKLGEVLKNQSGILKIKKVVPAGSFGRDTILKGHLEVDCVYILEHNGYSFYNNFSEVKRCLLNLPNSSQFEINNRSISFNLEKPIGTVSVDLFAAYEINSPEQMAAVKDRDFYYGSTSLLQNKYFKNVIKEYPFYKDLVRLIKLWRNTWNIPLTSYMIELIVSHALHRTKGQPDFSFYLEACFRNIQSFTDGSPIIPVFWMKLDDSKITAVYSPENLFIVDLSDLSENIAIKITKEEKDYIRSEASAATSYLHDNNYSFLYE